MLKINKRPFLFLVALLTAESFSIASAQTKDTTDEIAEFERRVEENQAQRDKIYERSNHQLLEMEKARKALKEALKSLNNFDCNVAKFQVIELEKRVSESENLISKIRSANGCNSESDSSCLMSNGGMNNLVSDKAKDVERFKEEIKVLKTNIKKCDSKE